MRVGLRVGDRVGFRVGVLFGLAVGLRVGALVEFLFGLAVGFRVGALVAFWFGLLVGVRVGALVGALVEFWLGLLVGVRVGTLVGALVVGHPVALIWNHPPSDSFVCVTARIRIECNPAPKGNVRLPVAELAKQTVGSSPQSPAVPAVVFPNTVVPSKTVYTAAPVVPPWMTVRVVQLVELNVHGAVFVGPSASLVVALEQLELHGRTSDPTVVAGSNSCHFPFPMVVVTEPSRRDKYPCESGMNGWTCC